MNRQNRPLNTDYNDFTQNCIQFKDANSMVYAPMKISVGAGYYAANPLDCSSLLKEKTWARNYRAGPSMQHEVEYTHALDKDLEINVKENFNYTYDPVWEGLGTTQMKINEDVRMAKPYRHPAIQFRLCRKTLLRWKDTLVHTLHFLEGIRNRHTQQCLEESSH